VSPRTQQALRRRGEQLALEHYERLGFALLARNQPTRAGEIDLIVTDGSTIVFVEVTARRIGDLSPPPRATAPTRTRLAGPAAAWLAGHADRSAAASLRIDAVAVVIDECDRLVALEQVEGAA
jgi:putative endonuclease